MNNYQATDSANGTLDSGSVDNVRWEISGVNTGSGTFSLIVRQGNDTATQKNILETFNNLSLDPFQDNYVEKAIGNQKNTLRTDSDGVVYLQTTGSYVNKSRYVRVKQVLRPTPQFFNNAGTPASSSAGIPFVDFIPVAGSGSFISGSGENFPSATSPAFLPNAATAPILIAPLNTVEAADIILSFRFLSLSDSKSSSIIALIILISASSGVVNNEFSQELIQICLYLGFSESFPFIEFSKEVLPLPHSP